jgi:CRP-like cAMP-binding protein
MPRASATAHELQRVPVLASLPGQTLQNLAKRMTRDEVAPGTAVISEGEPGDRFYVLLAGIMRVSQTDLGQRGLLRPGDYFGEVALTMNVPRTASVHAVTPSVVAYCDRETFDEFVRPLFADDD